MGLEYQIDSLDGLDESIAGLYIQDEDKYVLEVQGLPKTELPSNYSDPVELKSALQKERTAKRELEKELKKFKNFDVEKYEQTQKELQQIRENEQLQKEKEAEEIARRTGEWENQKKTLLEKHSETLNSIESKYKKEIEDKESLLNRTTSKLKNYLLDNAITKSIVEADGNIDILEPHVRQYVDVIDDEKDGYVIRVLDQDNQIRLSDTGDPMTVDDLLNEFKEKPAFQGEGIFKRQMKSGGSSSQGNKTTQTSVKNPFKKETLNYTEQALLEKKDPALAARLKLEAGIK